MFIEREKPRGQRRAFGLALEECKAKIDHASSDEVPDLQGHFSLIPRKRKRETPRELNPGLIRVWQCIVEFSSLVDAIEQRDFDRSKECQARLLADFGLQVGLGEGWETKWPESPPEADLSVKAEK